MREEVRATNRDLDLEEKKKNRAKKQRTRSIRGTKGEKIKIQKFQAMPSDSQ